MSEVKWIKITTDIFDDEKMFAIETLPDGHLLELVWFKILCLAGRCNSNGFLVINNSIPYTDEMLSKIFRLEIGVVQRALDVFIKLGMIEIVDNTYMVSNWLIHQNGNGLEDYKKSHAEAQKRYRESQKQKRLESSDVTSDVTSESLNDIIPSYSYSNSKSNVLNLNSLIDIEEFLPIKENEELYLLIKDWMEYKDAKGKQHLHYAEKSIKSLLKTFIDNNNKYGTSELRSVVDFTIGQGYQGIVWDKLQTKREVNAGTNANKSDWLKMWENA